MQKLIALGVLLIFVGVIVVFAGIVGMLIHDSEGRSEVKAGGVIFVGPLPLVFGTDRNVFVLSILGALLVCAAYLVWRSR